MPVRDQFGNVATGLWGGMVTGKKDEQTYRGKESNILAQDLMNISNSYKFQEYVDNRFNRDVGARAKRGDDQIKINTEESREDLTRSGNKLQAEQAKTGLALEPKNKRNQGQALDYNYEKSGKEMDRMDREAFAPIYSAMQRSGKPVTIDEWPVVYRDLVRKMSGRVRPPEETAKYLEQVYGITGEYSPRTIANFDAIGQMAMDDVKHVRARDLLMLEWEQRAEVARIDALAKGTKPIDLSTQMPKELQYRVVGQKLAAYAPKRFNRLKGSYDRETGDYSGDQGALAAIITDKSRNAVMAQKRGQPVSPEQLEHILMDLYANMPQEFVQTDVTGSPYIGRGDRLNSEKFNMEANRVLGMVMSYYETEQELARVSGYTPRSAGQIYQMIKQQALQ